MASYRVRVHTGSQPGSGTADSIAVTLVGTRGASPKTRLDGWGPDFCCGTEREYRVVAPRALGPLLLVRVHKEPYGRLPQSSWFLEGLRVWPEGTWGQGGPRGPPG
ncbi:arachidonate 12-lipoxygenase, 12R-type-like [Anser cygnoides]|uniref:arachidonate 12-lipoxygenase, 12R-type-like n=1 Tax=Anser cygnoides TaxID=8845 RepID=UPI0034D2E0A4